MKPQKLKHRAHGKNYFKYTEREGTDIFLLEYHVFSLRSGYSCQV